jgi:hypothetical protein
MAQILPGGFLFRGLLKLQSAHPFMMEFRPVPVSMPERELLYPLLYPGQVVHQIPPAPNKIPNRFFLPVGYVDTPVLSPFHHPGDERGVPPVRFDLLFVRDGWCGFGLKPGG